MVVSGRADEPAPTSAFVTGPEGLDEAAVRERVARGEVNASGERTSRTLPEIIRANLFTRFNAILGTMLGLILVFGHPADGLFGIVLVANALIGIVQEIRAKRTLDRLAVLNAPIARVVRAGTAREVAVDEVVLDDLVELLTGDQLPADGTVRSGDGLEIDESLLTGESEPVNKQVGDEVLSGSFVVAGSGRFQATRVGADSYARRLAHEARRFALTHSELVDGINKILRYVTWAILVVGPLLFWSQLQSTNESLPRAITSAVAGVVGMVPEGLVLLTSLAFGVAAVTLARRQVLVQELPAVEGLARVDVVCLDKTGTLTEGSVVFDGTELLDGSDEATVAAALAALGDDPNANATVAAIATAFPSGDDPWTRTTTVPFSSARKWSAATFVDHGSWILGAPEMVYADASTPERVRADELAARGNRVLMLAHTDLGPTGEELPPDVRPVALVLLGRSTRASSPTTSRRSPTSSRRTPCTGGSRPTRSARWSQHCSRAATSWP